jgi:hypothetical protein
VRYQLLGQEDDLGRVDLFLVAAGVRSGTRRGTQFTRLDDSHEDFDHVLCAADGTPSLIANLLLMNALEDKVQGLGGSPVTRAVRQGVLLFRQVDSAMWELAVTRPTEGRVRALVQASLSEAFMRLLAGEPRRATASRFDGWREIAPFDITELREPLRNDSPALASVRCLQRVEIGAQLHLIGGVRVDGGYLGFHGLLPEVHCPEADDVALFRVSRESGELRSSHVATLTRVGDRVGVFRWSSDQDHLEGAHVFAGIKQGRVVAPRQVLFHSRGLSHDYEQPTDPTRWFVEASATDILNADVGSDVFLGAEMTSGLPQPSITAVSTADVSVLKHRSADDHDGHDRLVETLAAISVARKGIAEAELFDLVGKLLFVPASSVTWGVIRGWLEAGYLDCLARRQWRGRVYFARRPRVVVMPDHGSPTIRAVVHGLAPYRLRTAVRDTFSRSGAVPLPSASLSEHVPAPLAWRFESREHALATIARVGELGLAGVREPRELVGDFDAAVSDGAPLPPGYECQRVWNWAAQGFRRPADEDGADAVRIEYHIRTNGPDRYVVATADVRRATLSRSWALLDGFRRAGVEPFAGGGSIALIRHGPDGPHIPLPLARALGLRAGVVAGPARTAARGWHYAYAAESPSVRGWLLSWLKGAKLDEGVMRRFAWLGAAVPTCSWGGVPIPADIRQRMRKLDLPPELASITDRRVPRHFLPHLRRAIDMAELDV